MHPECRAVARLPSFFKSSSTTDRIICSGTDQLSQFVSICTDEKMESVDIGAIISCFINSNNLSEDENYFVIFTWMCYWVLISDLNGTKRLRKFLIAIEL